MANGSCSARLASSSWLDAVFYQLQELIMQCDVHTLECVAGTGNFSSSLLLLLVHGARCCQMLLYFFRCPPIQRNASVPALRGSFVCVPSLLNAVLMVSDELCFQFHVLGPLDVIILLHFPVQRTDCAVITYHACVPRLLNHVACPQFLQLCLLLCCVLLVISRLLHPSLRIEKVAR